MSMRELYRIGVALEDCVIALRAIRDNGPGLVAQHHDALNDAIAALSTLRSMRERAVEGRASRWEIGDAGTDDVDFFGYDLTPAKDGDALLILPEPPEAP